MSIFLDILNFLSHFIFNILIKYILIKRKACTSADDFFCSTIDDGVFCRVACISDFSVELLLPVSSSRACIFGFLHGIQILSAAYNTAELSHNRLLSDIITYNYSTSLQLCEITFACKSCSAFITGMHFCVRKMCKKDD